ncbi:MAG: FAD-binding oxidoreductase [Rhodospirillaceae bacterium]|nr:FAD-binding oxidoreductase [Rhodospirillaceae bacterium]
MARDMADGYKLNLWERLSGAPHPAKSFGASFWYETAPEAPVTETLVGEAKAEVAVVGGGYLGLSAALHLAEAGVDVALLEADEAGFGASGRNAGFVVPNLLTGLDPKLMREALGTERGDLLCRTLGEGGDLIFDLIRRHNIDCEGRQSGWIQPLHTPAKQEWLEDRVEQWRALGRPVEALSADQANQETGATSYHGAFLDPTGGHVNPLGLVRGYAKAAIEQGARIYTSSRVQSMERAEDGDRKGWRLKTDKGTLFASKVLLTTNATGDGLAPAAENTQYPITLFQVATEPLDPELRKSVLPNDRSSADTRKDLIAFRWTWDNRLVTGGLLASPFGASELGRTHHLDRLQTLLPQLPPLKLDYAWQGRLAAARDFMPRLMSLGPEAYSAITCNGRGMAMTTAMGKAFARYLTGGSNEELPVPITDPNPIPLPSLASLAFSVWLPFNRWIDARDLKAK